MSANFPGGYAGKVLHVDLNSGKIEDEALAAEDLRRWVGGSGLGAKYLWEEVHPGIGWSDAENRLIITAGPLGGTRLSGTGSFNIAAKGCMTDLSGFSQANGYMGAFLKFNGYDGIVIAGKADAWTYLAFHDGKPELRDASHLVGKGTWETEDLVRGEFGATSERQMSVFAIGPAGENLVRFAAVLGDRGHAAGHNGLGAVMGAKRLKAIAATRGKARFPVHDPDRLAQIAGQLFAHAKQNGGGIPDWGTGGGLSNAYVGGWLPVKNYSTYAYPAHEVVNGRYIRTHFEHKPNPCWACRMACSHLVKVTEGPYAGYEGEEPEYEGLAAMGPQIGVSDAGAAVMLGNECDRLGLEINEAGWVIGFAMECFEKGLITKIDLGGLDLTWGNAEATRELLHHIARREGFGDLLAEGVRLAAQRIGGEAPNLGVYTLKGASPRGHDHRGRWLEMLDTCTSGTSTIEATFGGVPAKRLGLPPLSDRFSPEEVSTLVGRLNGWHQFEDCLGVCRFCFTDADLGLAALNAVTGWDIGVAEAMTIGRRIVNRLRVFNLKHGLRPEMERPSPRYGSTPQEGPAAGIGIAEHWASMVRNFRQQMGWDPETGRPLPETLRGLGLEQEAAELWG